jgi:hypothetical protein
MPERGDFQEIPDTDNASKDLTQEERSTANSPPKATLERTPPSPPMNEMTSSVDGDSKLNDNVVVDPNPAAKNQEGQPPNVEEE